MKKLRIGLVGAGSCALWAHVPCIKGDPDATLAAAADPDKNQLARLHERWGGEVPAYPDIKSMLRAETLDGVMIATPHALHYSEIRLALENGLHVLVEKPLTIFPHHAASLVALAAKRNRILAVSYQRHHQAQFVFARELIRKGALGEVRGVAAYMTQNWNVGGWRLDHALSGGGFVMDSGSHLIGAMLWLTGLQAAFVSASVSDARKRVEKSASAQIRFTNGAQGALGFFGNTKFHDERIAIHGTRGCIVFHLHEWRLHSALLNNEPMKIPARIREQKPDADFFRWMRGGRGFEYPRFAIDVAKLTHAIYRSAEEKRGIRVSRG